MHYWFDIVLGKHTVSAADAAGWN